MPSHLLLPALNIGIVGHRPNRLAGAHEAFIRQALNDVLTQIAEGAQATRSANPAVFDQTSRPALALVSSLAEGADRMAAEIALDKGYALHVPLPMPAAAFETDFSTAASRQAFRDLLARAQRVAELPAPTGQRDRAYAAAARLLLDHCDLLIAVWDGRPPSGRGGTANSIDEACRRAIPVVIIDAKGTEPATLIWSDLDPAAVRSEDPEVLPRKEASTALVDAVAKLMTPPEDKPRQALLDYMQSDDTAVASGDALVQAFDRADRLASANAGKFRRAVIWNFVAAFSAILLAALGVGLVATLTGNTHFLLSPLEKKLLLSAEVLLLLSILAVTVTGWRNNWHKRWIEGRYIAEYLRAAIVLRKLGTRVVATGGALHTHWPDWYVQACLRSAGLPGLSCDEAGLSAARDSLKALVADQNGYHHRAAHRAHAREHLAEVTGLVAFAGALGAVLWALFGGMDDKATKLAAGIIAIVLPALGASLLGIRMVLDYAGVAARSHAAARHCESIAGRLDKDPLDLRHLRARAAEFAGIALADVSTWRHSAEGRKLDFPG